MDDSKTCRQFKAAVKVIQGLPKDGSFKPSHELMLKFYGFYKQATAGTCTASKPGFWDVVGKAKWEAWSSLGSMSCEEAMEGYVHELTQIVEMMPQTDEVSHLVRELDEFQEMIRVPPEEIVTNGLSEDSCETSLTLEETHQQPLSNGHVPNNTSSRHHPVSNESIDRALPPSEQSTHATSAPGEVVTHSTPDILSAGQSSSHSIAEAAGSARSTDSDTDSEDYMDSSDVVSTPSDYTNAANSKAVDLLASCPPTPTLSTTTRGDNSIYVGTYTTHSTQVVGPSTSSTHVEARRPAVTFLLPDEPVSAEGGASPSHTDTVNEKLRMALLNMQQEMSALEKRLSLVEQITVKERRRQLDRGYRFMKWWPFPDLQPRSVALILVWPVFVAWFMKFLSKRRRRR